MASVNKVILIGNLTRDPELRYTPKGTAVAKLGLAVNRSWRDPQSGDTREEVTFVDVDAFGKQAETLGQYLKKGRPIYIEGRLRLDSWEDKQTGQKRSKLGVVMESFQFLDSGRGREDSSHYQEDSPSPSRPSKPTASASSFDEGAPPPDDDDVPF